METCFVIGGGQSVYQAPSFRQVSDMSMLKAFFEIGCDKMLFDGLAISRERELCQDYMGRFLVVSVSLKGVEGGQL